jgi:Mg2+/Co2+ transporter CorC
VKERDKKQSGLDDVIREETSRGRRPVNIEERRRRATLLEQCRDLLRLSTEEEFAEVMRASGVAPDSEHFQIALRAWREYRES